MAAQTTPRTIAHADWKAEAARRFGADPLRWRFVCPSCGHVAEVAEWRAVAAPAGAVAFACLGRFIGDPQAAAEAAFLNAGGPCNYTSGGLFNISPVTVELPDGTKQSAFEFDLGGRL
jgi:hypothetical protein